MTVVVDVVVDECVVDTVGIHVEGLNPTGLVEVEVDVESEREVQVESLVGVELGAAAGGRQIWT